MKKEIQKNFAALLKAISYKLKAAAIRFVVVVALAFLFAPTGAVYAQTCTCADGVTCPVECTDPARPVCEGRTCQAVFSRAVELPPITFSSPTGIKTFSGVMCTVIDFFSQTILPPLAVLMMLVVGFLFMMGGQMPQKAIDARKTLLYVVAGVVLLLLAPGIIALVVDVTGASSTSFTMCPGATITTTSIVQTITNLINWFAWFVSITSVAMGLYAGLLYLTARGDPSKVQEASKVFSYTIIGIAVAVVSFSIIVLTKTLFGI